MVTIVTPMIPWDIMNKGATSVVVTVTMGNDAHYFISELSKEIMNVQVRSFQTHFIALQ
ncbi:hypothetical protein ES703_20548 [subsurface metagenome]